MNDTSKILLFVGGSVLLLPGLLMLVLALAMAVDIGDPTAENPITFSTVLCVGLPGLIGVGLGGGLLWVGWRQLQAQRREQIERQILQVAIANDYRVTAAQVAAQTHYALQTVQSHLDRMARQGTVSTEISPDGQLIYYFRH